MLASPNQPNIAKIHGLERSGGITAVVRSSFAALEQRLSEITCGFTLARASRLAKGSTIGAEPRDPHAAAAVRQGASAASGMNGT